MIAALAAGWSLLAGRLKAIFPLLVGLLVGAIFAGAATTFAYEGLRLPLIGQVIDGRLQAAVKAAQADLVARAEYDALAAVLARKERDEQTARAAAAELRNRIAVAERNTKDATTRLDAALAADQDPDRSRVSAGDVRWMHDHQ